MRKSSYTREKIAFPNAAFVVRGPRAGPLPAREGGGRCCPSVSSGTHVACGADGLAAWGARRPRPGLTLGTRTHQPGRSSLSRAAEGGRCELELALRSAPRQRPHRESRLEMQRLRRRPQTAQPESAFPPGPAGHSLPTGPLPTHPRAHGAPPDTHTHTHTHGRTDAHTRVPSGRRAVRTPRRELSSAPATQEGLALASGPPLESPRTPPGQLRPWGPQRARLPRGVGLRHVPGGA